MVNNAIASLSGIFSDPVSNIKLAHYVINKLTPHGMSKNLKISLKLMLTQQTFETCMFQVPF